ncbi:type III-B CRISPR module RAMP protein Cmr6 [Marinomonas mediterranea]|jgi:CRISPR-associated RAMP protein, Cmr6 family|uniref:CRISPR-associated RAMP protein, Cmr6 family n=1 Tax=Marinomonas mediterranea (strain ATCC 700492 / JCM 21426 / NBRC 103028 / MMB-1) TaxID=717774 RepID=F2K1W2_MARM1|nr:type III-B CRISPR module RAMP protein Cmr6 [Marinomonas mediterranea]ADZ89956.1 CRISPR-associated RAMP protein, Cmr6 family [Marinomonas mediterranea MMB-1]WCN16166.1 type III-B CRISPR module RAMP protein Cmr6 [Marinomonas mediterranea MMB-1]
MSSVQLVPQRLFNIYEMHLKSRTSNGLHSGLLLDKGYPASSTGVNTDKEAKARFIKSICGIKASELYTKEFNQWLRLTSKKSNSGKHTNNFEQLPLTLSNRLLIGLNGGGALETGCMINHHNGMPYIPGSSIKGAVRNFASRNLKDHESVWVQFFGNKPEDDLEDPFAGLITFHDAWWIPNSAPSENAGNFSNFPFIQDIVTTHHAEYYSKEGKSLATDFDDPIPNSLISVHGSFLFVIGGNENYLGVVKQMLEKTLKENGIGAKSTAGYGYFDEADESITKQFSILLSDTENTNTTPHSSELIREVSEIKLSKIPDIFGRNRNKTKNEKGKDYRSLCLLVCKHFGDEIANWATESGNKAKAYKELKEFLE